MKKIIERLLVFFIGVPLIVLLVYFQKWHHLPLQIGLIVATLIATKEVYDLTKKKISVQPLPIVIFLATVISLINLIVWVFGFSSNWFILALIFSVIFSLSYEIFSHNKTQDFSNVLPSVASTLFVLFYVPFLLTFVARLTSFEHSRPILVLFFLLVFGCDSFAWLLGILFGKGNRGIVSVSPNKSLVGFISGIVFSILIAIGVQFLAPEVFAQKYLCMGLTGFFTAIAAICGDLAESAIKRSAQIKDSGAIMPGRGGLLDSIDSILFAAPVYYLAIYFFFS